MHVSLIDANGSDTGALRGWRTARTPFGAFDSAETLALRDGVFGDTLAGFSLRVYRIGCTPPPPVAGNLLRNGDFEELTISGAVAWWGLFWQNDFRDPRVKLVADTEHALSGRYSARLILPCDDPAWPSSCRATPGPLPLPLSLGASGGPSPILIRFDFDSIRV